ncbi:GGDEF domain-containing protein [Amycolatopsis jiangsuensis]|uniref:Diguanylate cyclase (GGDEF)-like protein n=1 Tax=Amycolatopsis jiangsuensis TaxID=1181879 RepID=A0A840IWF0_9PSEU|nr:GGDEF domain-containing protein [Amycolatopsis jiangsuensis]MBB4685839.1 diguanylate cyclase (GGDEF)-like protein [Amycolatopsis jiangsuensis]
MRTYVLLVNVVAVGASLSTAWLVPVTRTDLLRFGVLAVCAAAAIEATRHIERQREYNRAATVAYVDTKAVWSIAAVIALPAVLATAMVVFTYAVAWWRIWPRERPVLPHRWIFSAASVLCGTQAAICVLALGMHHYPGVLASGFLPGLTDLAVIVLACGLRWAINTALVMAAIALSSAPRSLSELFAGFGDQLLEAGAIGLGLVTAALLLLANPLLLAGVVLALVALHRGLLLTQFQRDARTDVTTGLATKRWWRTVAEQYLDRARSGQGTVGVLLLDLDHFKAINDTYGHPTGDLVLREIAIALCAEVREQDMCGRWGGEEFAIVLPNVPSEEHLGQLADRIRCRVPQVVVALPDRDTVISDLTVSIGCALYPAEHLSSIDDVLVASDTALYRAKQAGRNRVELATR